MALELSTIGVSLKYCVETTAGTRPTTGYTPIAGIKAIPDLNPEPEALDVTDLSDSWRRYIPGVRDVGGAISFTANFTSAFKTAWTALVTAAATAAAVLGISGELAESSCGSGSFQINLIDRISKFTIARLYTVPSETYYFGSQSGNLRIPISSVTPTIQRGTTLTDNRFTVDYASQSGVPVSKVDLDVIVEPTGNDGTFNNMIFTTIELWKHHSATGSEKIDEITVNTSVKTPIHFTSLVTASGGTSFYFIMTSGYTHQLLDTMKLTVENIGMNN